jgi:hypothetical protein
MKIRMLSGLDGRYAVGDEPTVSDALAVRLIQRGYAVPAREPEIERAVVVAPENAVKRPRKRKTKRDVEPS